VSCRIDEEGWSIPGVQVAMQRWRVVGLAEERVLGEEASQLGIEVAGLGVVEAGFLVVDVAGEGEAVGGVVELVWESEVAPGILGNLRPLSPSARDTTTCSRGAGVAGAAHPLGFQGSPATRRG
jgi:hypothetical protein